MGLYRRIQGKAARSYTRIRIFLFNLINEASREMRLKSQVKNYQPVLHFESVNANVKREIEILPADLELSEVIFSCYFINKSDPQQNLIRGVPDIDYISPWYHSIEKIGVTGIIIHDGIDTDFIARHQTDKIRFRKYTPGRYSIFEERWIAYYMFLSGSNIKKAFFSDINDVYITRSPWDLIKKNPLALYVGKDNANKIKDSGWLLDELASLREETDLDIPYLYPYQYAYNAGVLGGSREVLLLLLSKIIAITLQTTSAIHKDMTILNLCIHLYFAPRIDSHLDSARLANPEDDKYASHSLLITGYPLNSEFKKYQLSSDAYFIHK